MQRSDDSWMPLSPATARLWAFEAMADAGRPRRRRIMPALRKMVAVTRRAAGRVTTGPRTRDAAPQPATE
jgi:hypothetical protein